MPTFDQTLEEAIHYALQIANDRRHEVCDLAHFLVALTYEEQAARVLAAGAVDTRKLRVDLYSIIDADYAELPDASSEKSEAIPTKDFSAGDPESCYTRSV